MITRHTDQVKAYKDVEYWFKQGYSVGILEPGEGDKWYTVKVMLKKPGVWTDRRSALFSMTLWLTLGAVLWVVVVAAVMVLVEWFIP